ncbi:GCN1-like protein [Mya arenaria]|uniref:GCN1-like protein n=1 Tax=Mya arenaria TaxID=6604 RepID=A0ABY7DXA4_MYAAR|nr:GCN1-like protein [Mya arenaria]
MADHVSTSTAELLKKFSKVVLSPSTKERSEVLDSVAKCVTETDLPEQALKGIFKFLQPTITVYRDAKSLRSAQNLVVAAIKKEPAISLKLVTSILASCADAQKKLVHASKSSAGDSLVALSWSCAALHLTFQKDTAEPALLKLIECQVGLVYGALAGDNTSISNGTYRKMRNLWKMNKDVMAKYSELLQRTEATFGYMLSSLQLDLSQYAETIIKPLGAQLTSKEPSTRDEACKCIQNLATQCSDHEIVTKVTKHLFGVFNGSEGKLTLQEQKMSVVQAVGNMSCNSVSGPTTLQDLSATVTELFIPLLSTEVHEATLIHALSIMSLWCAKFYTKVPDKLMQWFQKGYTLKSSTSPGLEMVPILIQSMEKAGSQSTQVALVTEAVSAANILVKLCLVDINEESKFAPFWSLVLDSDKQVLVNEKYLSSVSETALEGVVTLSEKLILEFPTKIIDKVAKPFYRALAYCLTRKAYTIRKFTRKSISRLLSTLGGTSISLELIEVFNELLATQKVVDVEALNFEEGDRDTILEQMKYISPRILSSALVAMAAVKKPEVKDAVSIAKATLIPAHHPCSKINAIKTLARIAPDEVLPSYVAFVERLLGNDDLVMITKDEYGAYRCHEGELYDEQLASSLNLKLAEDHNIRRENKLYSYKEQMEELELRMLNHDLCKGCDVVRALVSGNAASTGLYMRELCRVLVPLLQSPLAAGNAADVMAVLGASAFEDENLGNLLSNCTIRLLKPECGFHNQWCDEQLQKQATRVVNILFAESVPEHEDEYYESNKDERKEMYPAPCFAFMFYLLSSVLTANGVAVGRDEAVMGKALKLISTHAKMRNDSKDQTKKPDLFPIKELLHLLIRVIGVSSMKIQQRANVALVEVATCVSGKPGCAHVKEDEIRALKCLVSVLPNIDDNFELGLSIAQRVWVACYDVDENVRALAQSLREDLGLDEPYDEMCSPLVDDITHPEEIIRRAAAECLAKALTCHKENIDATIQLLLMNYEKKLEMPPPILDEFGRVVSEQMQDEWQPRTGVAMALGHLAPILPPDQLLSLFNFYVPKGLGDRSSEVRSQMRQAALAAINVHGKDNVSELLPVFEEFLTNSPGTASYDAVRQSIVILMGSLAKHLDKDNPKVKPIVGQLISALSTPSQDVQESVANCLPPLVPAVKSDAPELVHKLMDLLLQSDNYGERKGAAYGLAGLVRGLGITALKQLDIMTTLEEAVKDKKNPRRREDETSKAVMKMLTAHGVKLVLPSLLKGAVELLGSMAYCAPKQLSACLPSIVPKISEVLTDSHVRVQKAGSQALRQIGNVIRNPEIQAIVPVLMDALQDPARKTSMCLQTLLETKFVHFIDAPSLALIMPVVERAFQDRATETRKMSAQIIGNMYSLTDQKDLDPYIEKVIPGLKQSLLDPVPEVRSVSARALGAMVKGMGGARFDELMNWLMETLKSEGSSVDRSGAAQDLHKLMPIIISTGKRMDIPPHVRDGYIMMYIYLPSRIINMYANTAISLLLPELEMGLFDDNWRIRYSSIQLLGDLLYSISGVSGKMSTESAGEDDNFGTESSQTLILKVLGVERRNRVLSGLYMGRCDSALLVRQAALHVWKVVVPNTPRTLREILSTLFSQLLGCLASTSHDKRQVAARTLGDLVRKLGERVLPEIIPILESGLQSEQSEQRQGVCIGLREIMNSTQREHIMFYADSLIPTVKQALCDPLPEVREAAASTFDRLHTNIGSRALDDILPDLLSKLGDGTELSEQALDGLTQVMIVKSRVVLPYLVPQLTHKPVNTRALSYLASVSGEALTKHLPKILPALMSALSEKAGTPEEAQELEYCRNVVLSVEDEVGVRTIMEELLGAAKSTEPDRCRSSVTILHSFCENTRVSYEEFLPQLFRGLIELFVRKDQEVLLAAWECLNAITKKLNPQDMLEHIHNGITPVLPIFREGILTGSQDIKELSAIALGELIKKTSAEALKPSVVQVTGPLIRILGDRFAPSVKTAVLETLTLLLSKVGVMLKPFLPQLQTTFMKALNDPNRSVRLKAASALGKLIVIHTRVDPLFTELHSGIKNAEETSVRDTMLQALRFCLAGAGAKMSPANRKLIVSSLVELLGSPEDSTRMVASGCVGVLCGCLPEEELTALLIQELFDTGSSVDWTLRHGRGTALGVALQTVADKLWSAQYTSSVRKAVTSLTEADRIPLCMSGYQCLGYIIDHLVATGTVDLELVQAFTKGLRHDSNDVKQLIGQIVCYITSKLSTPLDATVCKVLVSPLVMGTKEKNTVVKTNSELALISLLQLRKNDSYFKSVLRTLDSGMQDVLAEVYSKSLKKMATQHEPPADRIDDTVLLFMSCDIYRTESFIAKVDRNVHGKNNQIHLSQEELIEINLNTITKTARIFRVKPDSLAYLFQKKSPEMGWFYIDEYTLYQKTFCFPKTPQKFEQKGILLKKVCIHLVIAMFKNANLLNSKVKKKA